MARLFVPNRQSIETQIPIIKKFLADRGIVLEQWTANKKLSIEDGQDQILNAYSHELKPFMAKYGFKTADVINVHKETPNIEAIRQKFLKEHIHSEDEVRFFVDGEGYFWFHLGENSPSFKQFGDEVFCVHCCAGDFLSVPKGQTHWFDLAPKYFVKAIRIFSNQEGWVANYTNSGVEQGYQWPQ